MARLPVIFLTFAGDPADEGRKLHALIPERDAITDQLIPLEGKIIVREPSPNPDRIVKVLNQCYRQMVIFHFSGHADEKELDLGEIGLAGPSLARLFSPENKLKLVFLNACATEGHVAALQAQGIAAIIATETSISDQKAKIFSEVFYHALANDKTLKEAFSDAKTAIEPHHPDDRVRMLKWGDEEEKPEKAFSWGLHILPGKEDVVF